ncbi:MAG: hypothetical protein J6Y60_05310 [Treponema sp.]|nr:hypothetical protein [Treponema sp.]
MDSSAVTQRDRLTMRHFWQNDAKRNDPFAAFLLETAKAELERFFVPEDYCDYPSPLFDYLYAQDEL